MNRISEAVSSEAPATPEPTAPTTNLKLSEIEVGDTFYVYGPLGLHDSDGSFVHVGHTNENGSTVFVDDEIVGRSVTVFEVDRENGDVLVGAYIDGYLYRQWTGFEGLTFPVAF